MTKRRRLQDWDLFEEEIATAADFKDNMNTLRDNAEENKTATLNEDINNAEENKTGTLNEDINIADAEENKNSKTVKENENLVNLEEFIIGERLKKQGRAIKRMASDTSDIKDIVRKIAKHMGIK